MHAYIITYTVFHKHVKILKPFKLSLAYNLICNVTHKNRQIRLYFTAIVCSDLPAPDNGRVSYSTGTIVPYDFGTTATYICDTGFGLVGGATRSCSGNSSTVDGTWTGTVPTCQGKLHMFVAASSIANNYEWHFDIMVQ